MVPKKVIREKRKSQPHVGTLFKNTTPKSENVNRFTFRIAIIFGKKDIAYIFLNLQLSSKLNDDGS